MTSVNCTLAFALVALVLATPSIAQNNPGSYLDPSTDSTLFQTAPKNRNVQGIGGLKQFVDVGHPGASETIALRLAQRSLTIASLEQDGESASQSIQNGGNSLSSAATSLVTKAVSSLLGVAEEAGAISSSSSGSATTLTAGFPQFLESPKNRCYIISPSCTLSGALLGGASASVSFNTSTSTNPSGTNLSSAALAGIAGTQNPVFSSFSFQESFHGRKNPGFTQQKFQDAINKIPTTDSAALSKAEDAIQKGFINAGSTYTSALNTCISSLQNDNAVGTTLQVLLNACLDQFVNIAATIPNISTELTTLQQAEAVYNLDRHNVLGALFYRSTFSAEYTLTNNLNQPTQSTIKGIYGYQSKSGALQTTANGSVSLYNTLEGSSVSRVRSSQGAVQFDWKPTTKPTLQAAWSAGYYFQYMVADGLINLPSTDFAPNTTIPLPSSASVLLNTTGPIHIGQGKVTLSIKGTNISIPLAITGASRTDLIKATKVSGNFGISYDFSSIFSSSSATQK